MGSPLNLRKAFIAGIAIALAGWFIFRGLNSDATAPTATVPRGANAETRTSEDIHPPPTKP